MNNWPVGTRRGGREGVELFGNRGEILSSTDDKVREISQALSPPPDWDLAKRGCNRTYSPLRLIWWASLVVGARGVLTDPFPATLELSSLDGTNGFILNGEKAGDHCGWSVSSAGDVNGDGLSDLVIGAYSASPSGRSLAGNCYVVYGRNFTVSTLPPFQSMDTSSSQSITTSSFLTPSLSSGTSLASSQQVSKASPISTMDQWIASSYSTPELPTNNVDNSSSHLTAEKSTQPQSSQSASPLPQSSVSDSTPMIAAIASAVAALVCSLLSGAFSSLEEDRQKLRMQEKLS